MASHDDLDLIRLFGLSAEEAGGLGLAPSAQPPRAAPPVSGGLPAPAERSSAARPAAQQRLSGFSPGPTGALAEPVPPAPAAPDGSMAAAGAQGADRGIDDELALLA